MNLFAISDLHIDHRENKAALSNIKKHTDDWLIIAGDVGHSLCDLEYTLDLLLKRFAKLIWVPGNHDLWTIKGKNNNLRGENKYFALVETCRKRGVLTPEDPFVRWPGTDDTRWLCPLFILYDYSFRPENITSDKAVKWANEQSINCMDEMLLHSDPYSDKIGWCKQRLTYSKNRLEEIKDQGSLILINHYPLREDLVRLHQIPRFSIWCGTKETENWHLQYNAAIVVTGHLHLRSTDFRDNTRFEEVSLGYPNHWNQNRGIEPYLRKIL